MDTNPLDTFSLGHLESFRKQIIDYDDIENAQQILDFIKSKISYENYLTEFRWNFNIRKNNIERLKNNGFEVWKISILTKNQNEPIIVYYILSKNQQNFEPIYKEELKLWGKYVISSEYMKL